MLSTVLITVFGVATLGALLYVVRNQSARTPVQEVPQESFRVLLEGFAIRLADLEARVSGLRASVDGDMKEVANAAERARYHAQRSKESAAELKELLGWAEEEGEDVRGDDAAGGDPQGVLTLPTGLEGLPGDDEQHRRVDPRTIAGMM